MRIIALLVFLDFLVVGAPACSCSIHILAAGGRMRNFGELGRGYFQ